MDLEQLKTALALCQDQMTALADAWLAASASAVSVWQHNNLVWQHPPHAELSTIYRSAPIQYHGTISGELRLHDAPEVSTVRLTADAMTISRLLHQEGELEAMTAELVETQDQLLALYELTRSTRRHLDMYQLIQTVARQTCELTHIRSSFAALIEGNTVQIAWQPEPLLPDADLSNLLRHMQQAGLTTLRLSPNSPLLALPPGVQGMLVELTPILDQAGVAIGALKHEPTFNSPEIKLIRGITEQAGTHVETMLLYQQTIAQTRLKTEMELARQAQRLLLPQHPPQLAELDIHAENRPVFQVSGDFYDFYTPDSGGLLFTIGDVAGKGFAAAMLMTMIRTSLRSKAMFAPDVTPLTITQRMVRDMLGDFRKLNTFATVVVGQFDRHARQIRYVNAGHAPVIYCPKHAPALLLDATGPAIGVPVVGTPYQTEVIPFEVGDTLILATDGMSEARAPNGDIFGFERLLTLCTQVCRQFHTAPEIAAALLQAIERFTGGHDQDDDQTLLVIRHRVEPEDCAHALHGDFV